MNKPILSAASVYQNVASLTATLVIAKANFVILDNSNNKTKNHLEPMQEKIKSDFQWALDCIYHDFLVKASLYSARFQQSFCIMVILNQAKILKFLNYKGFTLIKVSQCNCNFENRPQILLKLVFAL